MRHLGCRGGSANLIALRCNLLVDIIKEISIECCTLDFDSYEKNKISIEYHYFF
jgi:hypothetical protein